MRKIISVIAFLAVLSGTMGKTFDVLWERDDGFSREVYEQFYDLPRNSVDAVVIGPSAAREYYFAGEAFHHNGVVSYNLSTSGQPFSAILPLIKEVEKTQDPSVYLIEFRELEEDSVNLGDVRKITDNMKWSRNRIDTINSMLDQYDATSGEAPVERKDYYTSFGVYHNRWEDVNAADFGESEQWMGFGIYNSIITMTPEDLKPFDEYYDIDPYLLGELDRLISYTDTLDAKIVFVLMPAFFHSDSRGLLNFAMQQLQARGQEVLFLNPHMGDIGLSMDVDFREEEHVNTYGSIKVTNFLADYLQQQYGLPDRRGGNGLEKWTNAYEGFRKAILKRTSVLAAYEELGTLLDTCRFESTGERTFDVYDENGALLDHAAFDENGKRIEQVQ